MHEGQKEKHRAVRELGLVLSWDLVFKSFVASGYVRWHSSEQYAETRGCIHLC